MKDKDLKGFRGYVLFGLDERDLVERIATFLSGCRDVVFDQEISDVAREVCGSSELRVARIRSRDDVAKALREGARGVVFRLEMEKLKTVRAIALITGIVEKEE